MGLSFLLAWSIARCHPQRCAADGYERPHLFELLRADPPHAPQLLYRAERLLLPLFDDAAGGRRSNPGHLLQLGRGGAIDINRMIRAGCFLAVPRWLDWPV